MNTVTTQQVLITLERKNPDSWLTPRWILNALGPFDLDPCAAKEAPHWVCQESFTETADGLKQDWRGRVFLNPPYSDLLPWLAKMAAHRGGGIALLPAGHETQAWREYVWEQADAILFIIGRVRFVSTNGLRAGGRLKTPSAIVAYGQFDADMAAESGIGGVITRTWRVIR